MPDAQGKKAGIGNLRLTLLSLLLSAIAGLAGYSYHTYAIFRDAQRLTPRHQVERLIRDFRQYHSQTRQFPANFIEINRALWHTQPAPAYGEDGRRAWTKNYYYFYTRVNEDTCAFWALPLGSRRQYASTFFVVIAPRWLRVWKGKALPDAEIESVPPIPSPFALAGFGLEELQIHIGEKKTHPQF